MPDEWRLVALGEITADQQIGTVRRGTNGGATLPLLKMGNILWGGLDLTSIELIDEQAAVADGATLEPGDILFNTRNTPDLVGKTAYWPSPFPAAYDNNLMRIRLTEAADSRLVAAWMGSAAGQSAIGQFVCASTSVGAVYWRDLCALAVPLPMPKEQRRIAGVLDTWDDAIAVAEQLAKAKVRSFHGLIQQLIVNSTAPRDELMNLADLIKAKCNVDDGTFDYSVELDDIESQSGRLLGRTNADGLLGQRVCFDEGDTLFAKLRPYLRKSYHAREAGMASTEVWVLRAKLDKCLPSYLNYLVRSPIFQSQAERPTGSRMPRADWDWVQETPMPLPGLNEQGCIASILSVGEEDARATLDSLKLLRRQKRGLMQKLFTGEWRVPAHGNALAPDSSAIGRIREAAE